MKIVSEPYVKDGTAVFDVGGFSVSVVLEEIDSVTAAQYLRTSPGTAVFLVQIGMLLM